jgi:hypothetical protein
MVNNLTILISAINLLMKNLSLCVVLFTAQKMRELYKKGYICISKWKIYYTQRMHSTFFIMSCILKVIVAIKNCCGMKRTKLEKRRKCYVMKNYVFVSF